MPSYERAISRRYPRWQKRTLDWLGATVALLLTAPVIALVACLVLVFMGRPVFLRQLRPGLRGKPFHLYKFRTMRDLRDSRGRQLPDSERLTRLGSFLRATSVDELPELVNIFRGEMSLVGPRPLLMEYLPRYSSNYADG